MTEDSTGKGLDKVQANLKRHFNQDIWAGDGGGGGWFRRALNAVSRWSYLVASGFFENQCLIRASALTFTTILSIVPFLAVAFAISKGFGIQNTEFVRGMLLRITGDRAEVVEKILSYIANTNVRTLGWLGVATLLATVFSMVGTVEKAFNTIWEVRRGRTAWRKFTDFFSVILVCPLIILVSASLTVSLRKSDIVRELLSVSVIGGLEGLALQIVPVLLISMAFTFAYAFIPNTPVRLSAAAVGGFVAGVLWQSAQWAYINWQIGVTKYNAIYGSFAQLPLLLVWLYISWVIVLLGAEMAHAQQNLNSFTTRRFLGRASLEERQKVALLLMLVATRRFLDGEAPASMLDLARRLAVPVELMGDLCSRLSSSGLVVLGGENSRADVALARNPERIRVFEVLDAMSGRVPFQDRFDLTGGRFRFVDETFDALRRAAQESQANRTLAEFSGCLEPDRHAEAESVSKA
ncbi:YihY/virulence factor BrkB family protein [Desulfovibrio aminophilus]|nr:YihY/virulence factor BrkB family protein [Desulfovibrio aminophilus]MCM0756224.1 YihY/virulence factor BrkB family protein [Desulfovibrio aminophilus]